MRRKAVSRSTLQKQLRASRRQTAALVAELNAIVPLTIPYTATETIRPGQTIMLRIPKPFRVQPV